MRPSQLAGHCYHLTFVVGNPKTYAATNLDDMEVVLQDIPLSDGVTESPLFDGLRLVVVNLQDGRPSSQDLLYILEPDEAGALTPA